VSDRRDDAMKQLLEQRDRVDEACQRARRVREINNVILAQDDDTRRELTIGGSGNVVCTHRCGFPNGCQDGPLAGGTDKCLDLLRDELVARGLLDGER